MKDKRIIKLVKEYGKTSVFGKLQNFEDLPLSATIEEQHEALKQDFLYVEGKADEEKSAISSIMNELFKLEG